MSGIIYSLVERKKKLVVHTSFQSRDIGLGGTISQQKQDLI